MLALSLRPTACARTAARSQTAALSVGPQQSGVSGSISKATATARLITFELLARSARILTVSRRFGRVVEFSAMA
eukprot:COSAG02_NODE_10647_length_1892_cov_1.739543_1_plen_74_part_10